MDYNEIKYMHIERLGTDEVEGILNGKVYVFPKLDGTNGVVWYDKEKEKVMAGSRKRILSLENDNAGFYEYILSEKKYLDYFKLHPNHILYGEWLVPHTIKNYVDYAWKDFHIFDVGDGTRLLSYEEYAGELIDNNLRIIPALDILENPTIEDIKKLVNENRYLMESGYVGEGVVCKNYEYKNIYGRRTWAKLLHENFNIEKYNKVALNDKVPIIEIDIVNKYITQHLVDKEFEKIKLEENGWNTKLIPRLLNTVYHTFITEEIWDVLKKYKKPTINFRILQKLVFDKVKSLKSEIFS